MRFPTAMKRPPDFMVGGADNPYLLRWWITPWSGWLRDVKPTDPAWKRIGEKVVRFLPGIYLHKFLRDDDDRALHDHPWPSVSYILEGGYIEHLDKGRKRLWFKGAIVFRRAAHRHRIELLRDFNQPRPFGKRDHPVIPAWTVFITGFKVREWGFWCPSTTGFRFVHWKKFTATDDRGGIGKGCEE